MPVTASTAPPSSGCCPTLRSSGSAPCGQHLQAGGLARQKWPEELRFVDDFPRTASGKIQKNVLRTSLRDGGGHPLPFEVPGPTGASVSPGRLRVVPGPPPDGDKIGQMLKSSVAG